MATQTNQSRQALEPRDSNRENETAQERAQYASLGRGWHGDPEGHAAAGRKGGQTVSRNRDHMAQIGRKGGHARKDTGQSKPQS